MKLTVFLSVAGHEGVTIGSAQKNELESINNSFGIEFRCFLYTDEQFSGVGLIQSYIETLEWSAFFVPVLTNDYCDPRRGHVDNELRYVLERDREVYEMHRARFILPFGPTRREGLLHQVPPTLRGRVVATTAGELVKSFFLAFSTSATDRSPMGFRSNWPMDFFTQHGEPDVLLVLGHSGKESAPTAVDIRNLGSSWLPASYTRPIWYRH